MVNALASPNDWKCAQWKICVFNQTTTVELHEAHYMHYPG